MPPKAKKRMTLTDEQVLGMIEVLSTKLSEYVNEWNTRVRERKVEWEAMTEISWREVSGN